jgi:hypothetical protein
VKKLSEKQREFTLMVAQIILFAYARGYELTFGEAFRTDAQQKLYQKSGKSKARHSKHQDRLAVDFNLFVGGAYVRSKEFYRPIGEKWEELGGRWGGRFGIEPADYIEKIGWDANHLEYRG